MRNDKIFTRFKKILKSISIFILLATPLSGFAQYDYEHYVPPFYCSSQVGKQEVFLSTNFGNDEEPIKIKVIISCFQGGKEVKIDSVTIDRSNSKTYVFKTPGGSEYSKHNSKEYPHGCEYSKGIIGPKRLNQPLDNEGLYIYSYDGPFFANIRHGYSNDGPGGDLTHGFSLSAKGAYAKGKEFYSGHLYSHTILDGDPFDYSYWSGWSRYTNYDAEPIRSHSISVMAVEDGTTSVTFSGIKCKYITKYEEGKVVLKPIEPDEKITVDLSKGQSYVIGVNLHSDQFRGKSLDVCNGMNGTHITSTKKIVVNSGSWTAGAKPSQDIGFDQIVPVEEVRNKYVVMKGQGRSEPDPDAKHAGQERTIVVATKPATEVVVNGKSKGTLAYAGDFMILDDMVNPRAIPTLYIEASEDVYVYQTMCGTNEDWTNIGLNFIPPLTALGMKEVVIPKAEQITSGDFINPTVTVLAQKGVEVKHDGNNLMNPEDIDGTSEWVYYKVSGISGDCRFVGKRAINVAWTASSNTLGAAGYYSGFTKAVSPIHPDLNIDTDLSLICESYDDDIIVSIKDNTGKNPDFYEWYKEVVNGAGETVWEGPNFINSSLKIPAPNENTTWEVRAYYRDPSLEILFNGDFVSDEINGFYSDYEPVYGALQEPGQFTIARQPKVANPILEEFDKLIGEGKMFLAYSKNQNDIIYQSPEREVESKFNYIFKMYGRLAQSGATKNQSLKVLINDETIVENFRINSSDEWQSVSALWRPNGARTASVKILNNNLNGEGTYFAIDSISFVQAVEDTDLFEAKVIPNYSYSNNGKTFQFCEGVQNSLDVSNGDTSWYNYSWSKKDATGNFIDLADVAGEFSGTKTHELIFLNPQQDDEGDYRCKISFKEEYKNCGTSSDDVHVDLSVLVDEPATVKIDPDKTNFCYGKSANLNALVTGDAGQVKWYIDGGADPVSLENPFVFSGYDAGKYVVRCEAENGCGLAFDEVTLNVLSAPELTGLSIDSDLCEGKDVIINAIAVSAGSGTLKYYWKEGTTDLTEHGNVLTFPATMDHRSSNFSVSVSTIYTTADGNIECPSDVTINTDPLKIIPDIDLKPLVPVTLCETEQLQLVAEVEGNEGDYHFKWYKNDIVTTNETSTYLIGSVGKGDRGTYKVEVWNDCNRTESSSLVTVNEKMVANVPSFDKEGPFCNPTNVKVKFADSKAVTQYRAIDPNGVENIFTTDEYIFEVNATGKWQFITEGTCSDSITFEKDFKMISSFGTPTMEDVTVCPNPDEQANFKVKFADGVDESGLIFTWFDNKGNRLEESGSSLSIENVTSENVGEYSCEITDNHCSTKIVKANLTIYEEEIKTSEFASNPIQKCEGDKFELSIEYTGTPIFEWSFKDADGKVTTLDESTGTLTINSVNTDHEGMYSCKVYLTCSEKTIQRELVVHKNVAITNSADEHIDICEGIKQELSIEIEGDAYTLEWYDASNTHIEKFDNKTLVKLDALAPRDEPYIYTAKVSHIQTCVDSENAEKKYIIQVHEKPELTAIAPIQCEGDIIITADVTGTDYIALEWWNEDESKQLGAGINYTIENAIYPDSKGTYIAKLTTEYCNDIKANAIVNIYEPISYKTIANSNPTPCAGTPLKLVVEGIGDGIQYSWHKNLVSNPPLGSSSILDLGNADAALHNGKYICVLTSSNGCPGKIVEFTVSVLKNANVETPPSDVSLCEGITPATFTLTATGEGDLVYVWYNKDDIKVSEKTNDPNFSVADPLANNGQVYYCVVTPDKCSSVTSKKVGLHVKEKVLIKSEPVDVKIAENGNATFVVEAEGEPVITYQWQISTDGGTNWSNMVGETNKSLVLNSVPLASNGNKYRCVISNDCDSQTTREALLTVDANAKITVQPVDQNACSVNDKVEFTIDATGVGLNFEWQYRENDSGVFMDATAVGVLNNGGKTLEIDPVTSAMKDWEFKCNVSGVGDPDESNVVKINLFEPITFDEIDDVTICNGSGALFSVENLNGSTPYLYSWKRESTEIGTETQLNLDAGSAKDNIYWIEVGNGVCPAVKDDFRISHYPTLELEAWTITETCLGIPETLEVNVTKSAGNNLSYEWTKDDDIALASNTNAYELPAESADETGTYKVKVKDECMNQTISGFINVNTPVSKRNSWDDIKNEYCLDETLILDVEVDGDNPTYNWTVPNLARTPGTGSSIKFDKLSKADEGTYTCIVSGNCGDPIEYSIDITILEAPEITEGLENLSATCEGNQLKLGAINFNGSVNNIIWETPVGIIGVTEDDDKTYNLGIATTAMEGNYKVEVSNKCGSDISVGTQVVNPKPTLTSIPDQTVCEGEDVVFRAKATGRDLKYQWKIDGITQPSTIATLLISGAEVNPTDAFNPKKYDVECTVTNGNGCGDPLVETAKLIVNPSTIILATLKNVVRFVGQDYTMTVDATGHNLTYTWTHVKDGVTTTLSEKTNSLKLTNIQFADEGYYNCEIEGTCATRLATGKLTVKEPVVIIDGLVSLEEKCVGEPLSLSIDATGQISSVKWFKDGFEIPGETKLTLYIAELKATDVGVYTCKIEGEGAPVDGIVEETTVRVYENTTLLATLGTKTVCEGQELEWIPNVKGAANIKYKWFFGGVEISDQKILNYNPTLLAHEGNYEVQVTGLCGNVTTKGSLEVTELPVIISVSDNVETCENTSLVEFSVSATGEELKYQWRKNGTDIDGKTSPVLSLTSIQLDDEANYTCKVYNSCAEAISDEMTLKVIPQLRILSEMVDVEVCSGEEVTLTTDVEGNDVTYQWKLDGVDLTGENASILNLGKTSPDDSGYYTCIVSDRCTDSRSTKPTELKVHELPNSRILGRMVLCAKEDRVTYTTDAMPEIEYGWGVEGGIFAGPDKGLRTRITWGELDNGELSIMITDVVTGCESKVDSLVTLHALPDVNLALVDPVRGVCNPSKLLSGGYPEGGIYWVDDISEEIFDPAERGAGTYNVHYSYTDENGCSNVTSKTILRVDPLPTVNITDDITIGSCKPFKLSAETEESNIQWSPAADLDDANSMTPTFTPGKSQVLVATVMDEHGCTNMDLVELTVAPLPIVTTISDTTVGQCNQLQLLTDVVGDAGEITWTNPDHLDDPNIRSPKIVNAPEGTYTYKISVTDLYGCDAEGEVIVNMVADPELDEDKFACEGEKFEVNITGMENPIWEDGYTDINRTIDQPGKYLLTVENKYGCGDEQNFAINPTPKPDLRNNLIYTGPREIELVKDRPVTIFEGQTVTLAPNLPLEYSPYNFEWEDGKEGSILQRYEVSETGKYKLTVTDNLGCIAKDSVNVEVKPVGIESPNAFTPNSSNDNDKFYLKDINYDIEKFEMYIYNRWGELMYKTNEVGRNGGWDGKYKGKLCPAGAYVWMVFINGELTNQGTFMLIR